MLYELFLLFLVAFPFFWLRAVKSQPWEKVSEQLLPKFKSLQEELLGSLKLLVLLIAALILLTALFSLLEGAGHENDLEKVGEVVNENVQSGLLWFGVTLVIAVFIEELFFRAFLQQRIGLWPANIVFTLTHIGYGSVSELIGVFVLGLVLAYWFKKHKSLVQNYIGHLLYNFVAVAMYLLI